MTLSVIIPLYNVEHTLRRCVESVLDQDYGDFEILLIDDGSPDKSGIIAEEMAGEDKRISVFHKTNGGLSDARNYGLEHANGDYITFVDSDDELKPNTLGQLMKAMASHTEWDILEFPVVEVDGAKVRRQYQPGENVYSDAMLWLQKDGFTHCWVWNKIFKRWIWDDIRFPVGRRYEDAWIVALFIKKRPVIATVDNGSYVYNYNSGGITSDKKHLQELLEAQIATVSMLEIDLSEACWHRLYMDMLNIQLVVYRHCGRMLLHDQRVSLNGYGSTFGFVKSLMLNILGVKRTCQLYSLLRH